MAEPIFTERELSEHRRDEEVFVKAAMKGNMNPVLQFWKTKRLELVKRLFDRFEADGREKGVNCA